MKKLFSLFATALLLLPLAACQPEPEAPQPQEGALVQYATAEPDSLQDVIDLIYEDIDMKELEDVDDQALTDLFHIEPRWVESYAIRYSSGRYGVADVAIIKPAQDHEADVTAALETRRNDRIAEFENYDIHDSLNISKSADIFTRGSYIIMLMLEDSDQARTTILEQIPG